MTLRNEELSEVLERVRNGEGAEAIWQYRQAAAALESPQQWAHFDRLQSIHVSSLFMRKGNGEMEWTACTGLSGLVITGIGGEAELRKAKKEVCRHPQVYCAFEGADGHSLNVWTLCCTADGRLPTQQVEAQRFVAQAYAISYMALSPSCEFQIQVEEPKLERTCLMSYDPEIYVNPHAIPFLIDMSQERETNRIQSKSHKTYGFPAQMEPGAEGYVTMTNIFNAVYCRARQSISDWKPADEPLRMVCHVAKACAAVGLPEEEVTHRLYLMFEHSLREDEVRSTVTNIYSNEKQLGHAGGLAKHQSVAYRLREFMERRYDVRFNEVLQTTEFRERQSLQFFYRELDRREVNTIHHEALIEGIEAAFSEVDNLLHSSYIPLFNPISSFLRNLPTWDGKDYIAGVAALVPNDNPHWERLFRRWFLSMVAHWMNADEMHANATAPILIGRQGFRKSTFCRMLLPPELQGFFTDSIDFRSNTEAERCLSRFLLVNIDEFDQLSEKQTAFIKHLFQKPSTHIRRMYSESIGSQRRYASFIGTSNYQEVLSDPTGNRRYICIEVTSPIRLEEGINHSQLYAQAQFQINHGERYWLDDADEALLRETNKRFEVEGTLEQIFHSLFLVPTDGEPGEWMRLTDIMEQMTHHRLFNPRRDKNLNNLGKVLTKLNVDKMRKTTGMVYWVKAR